MFSTIARGSYLPWVKKDLFYGYPSRETFPREESINAEKLRERMRTLFKLDKDHMFHLQHNYNTEPKRSIEGFISNTVDNLLKGKYEYKTGGTSKLMLGSKGIGKSTTLRSCCIALSTMVPDLIPIYIQYSSTEVMVTPSEAISKNLEARGLNDDKTNINMRDLAETLYKNKLRALVIVDELDQLYQKGTNNEKALCVLDELSFIASDPSGLFYTIACGSSSALPLLITKNGLSSKSIVEEYPLIKDARNLNGSKFLSHRIGVGLMTRDEMVEVIKHMLTGNPSSRGEVTSDMIGLFRLFAGPNLRTMSNFCRVNDIDSLHTFILPYNEQDERATKSRDKYGILIDQINDSLISKNESIMRKIKHRDVKELVRLGWEDLIPLDRKELQKIVEGCKHEMSDMFFLIDNNWFTADENLSRIYPQIPFHLICRKLHPDPSTLIPYAKTLASEIYNIFKQDPVGIAGGIISAITGSFKPQ